MANPTTIRINPKTEPDLYQFVNEKRGPKKALKFLFQFYKTNNNLAEDIVNKIKEEIDFSAPKTTTTTRIKTKQISQDFEIDNEADDMLSNLIK